MRPIQITGNFLTTLNQIKKMILKSDKPNILRKRRFRNRLVLLYIDVLVIFFLVNILAAQILEKIMS